MASDAGSAPQDQDSPLCAPPLEAGPVVVHVEAELAPLIDEYLANRRADVRAISQLLAAGDYQAIWERGHNLKGVGAAYGFDYLTDLGAVLQGAARGRDGAAVRRCIAGLEDFLARLDVRLDGE